MMFAAFPVPWLQDLVLFKVLKPLSSVGILRSLLTADAGVFLAYLEDEVRAADIRRRVAASARALMADSQCNDLIIVTYADGCVVAFDMLTDPRYVDIRQRRRKLLTFGSGLN